MPKPKKKKFQIPKQFKGTKSIVLFGLVGLCLVIGASYAKNYADQKTLESNFAKISSDFDVIKQNIESKTGNTLTKTEECYRDAGKYQDGPLQCSVRILFEGLSSEGVLQFESALSTQNYDLQKSINLQESLSFIDISDNYQKIDCELTIIKDDKLNASFKGEIRCAEFSGRAFYPMR